MRYLVYLLIIANLAFFAWYQYYPPPAPRPSVVKPLPPGVEQLTLLSEREHPAEQPTSAAATLVEQEPQPDTVTTVDDKPEPIDEPVVVPVAETDEPEVASVPEPEVVSESESICQTVGPLLDQADVSSLSAMLSREGYEATVRRGEAREPAGYWVYMPAMPASQARRIVNDLDAHGMKDYFIGKQSYISLGIFSERDKAQTRLQQVAALGYEAVLDQRYRTRNVYWLDIEEPGVPLLGSPVWEKIQSQHADIRVQRVSCE